MSYLENRVRVSNYGSLPGDSKLLVPVQTTPGHKQQKLHVLAAEGLKQLSRAQRLAGVLSTDLLVASGWRQRKWASRAEYVKAMIAQYGSLAVGQKYRAFESPHETGLAVDFGCGGLSPNSKTVDDQEDTRLFEWLKENAYKYGWTPYFPEPWHWEFNVPLDRYKDPDLKALDEYPACEVEHEELDLADPPTFTGIGVLKFPKR
jgi:hypothetical protein